MENKQEFSRKIGIFQPVMRVHTRVVAAVDTLDTMLKSDDTNIEPPGG
jgi:hypothetical protein